MSETLLLRSDRAHRAVCVRARSLAIRSQMASVVVYTYSTWMNMIRSYNLSGIPYQYTYATVLTGAALGYMRNSTASQQYSLPISFRGENFVRMMHALRAQCSHALIQSHVCLCTYVCVCVSVA